MQPNK